jgi:hypothetical protein
MSEFIDNPDEEVYTIQVDYGNPHYKVEIKDKKAYIYIYNKDDNLYILKGYIDFKQLFVDKSNPTALLLKSDDNRYVYIGHKIFTFYMRTDEFIDFVCIKKGPFNLPYGITKEDLYGFTENLLIQRANLKDMSPFDFLHRNVLSATTTKFLMSYIYKEEIFDDSFYDKGIKPYKFIDDEIIHMEIGNKKVHVNENYLKVDQEEYIPEEIFIRNNTILALIDRGKDDKYKYLFVGKDRKYEFISEGPILKYTYHPDGDCNYAYNRSDTFFCFGKDERFDFYYIRSELNPIEFAKLVKTFYVSLEDFKPQTEDIYKFVPNVYYTHDNGGRPFRVTVDRKNKKVKVDVSNEEESNTITWTHKFDFKYINIFIGETDEPEKDLVKGNSILLQTNKDTYILISIDITEFKVKDQIKEFYSKMGNSDTYLPYAISDKYIYIKYQEISMLEKDKFKKINGVYDVYEYDAVPIHKIKQKILIERLY